MDNRFAAKYYDKELVRRGVSPDVLAHYNFAGRASVEEALQDQVRASAIAAIEAAVAEERARCVALARKWISGDRATATEVMDIVRKIECGDAP